MPNEMEELHLQITKEVQKFGDDVKKTYEELRTNHTKLQEIVDRNHKDQYDKAYVDKLALDVSTRQELLDKQSKEIQEKIQKQIERLNAIETAGYRPGVPGSDSEKAQKEEYEAFRVQIKAAHQEAVVKDRDLDLDPLSFEQYQGYKKALVKYLKSPNGMSGLSPEESKIMSVGVDPHGGYTVTPAMNTRVIQRVFEMDPLRQLCNIESITGPYMEWFVDWNEADCGWETETATGSEGTTPNIGKMRIDCGTMYARPKITQMLIEDSGINIEAWLANKVAEKFARTEATAFVTEDGFNGKPRGFLTYPAAATESQRAAIQQVNMGAAANITADGFISIKYTLLEYFLNSPNLAWLMNRATVADVLKLKYGSGEYIWKPGITSDAQSTILGIPARMAPAMPVVAANALAVALADWKEAYTIVDRLGITVQRDPYTSKPYVEYYTRRRVGGGLVNPQAIKLGIIHV